MRCPPFLPPLPPTLPSPSPLGLGEGMAVSGGVHLTAQSALYHAECDQSSVHPVNVAASSDGGSSTCLHYILLFVICLYYIAVFYNYVLIISGRFFLVFLIVWKSPHIPYVFTSWSCQDFKKFLLYSPFSLYIID